MSTLNNSFDDNSFSDSSVDPISNESDVSADTNSDTQNSFSSISLTSIDRKKVKVFVTLALVVTTVFTIVLGFDFDNTVLALKSANYWMLLLAFVFSLLPFFGASLALVSFTPEKVSLWDTIVMHVAGGVISLIAPAGFGILAVNVRFLYKHKISVALSTATVILTQIVQLFTTVLLIVLASFLTTSKVDFALFLKLVLVGLGVIVALAFLLLICPPLHRFVSGKVKYYYRQVKPRLVWVLANPRRLFVGWVGTVLMTMGYATCFYFVLCAFTSDVSYSLSSLTFITANQVGSSVPSPGAIGGVELALSGALRLIGVSTSIAVSTAVLYRVICFWIRIPFGWVALNYCQRKGLL